MGNEIATTTPTENDAQSRPVMLFDGVCNLCNGTVNFLIDRDPNAQFRFAALQSEAGRKLLLAHGMTPPEGDPDSVLLVENGKVYSHSTAALRVASKLGFPWKLAILGWIIPRPLRDVIYRFIARNRYRWFGQSESCRVPTPELRARFLK